MHLKNTFLKCMKASEEVHFDANTQEKGKLLKTYLGKLSEGGLGVCLASEKGTFQSQRHSKHSNNLLLSLPHITETHVITKYC